MTTAARPTFDTARGGTQRGEGNLSVLSKQYSSRDLTSHNKLKTRQSGQDPVEEVRSRDFKRDLIERERTVRDKGKASRASGDSSSFSSKRARIEPVSTTTLDADDPVDEDEDSDEDSDDEDDTAELLAELQRIKRDRAEEIMKKEQMRRQEEERIRTEHLLSGNPLLNQPSDFKVNRRWDDDVVFKNCAKDDKPKNHGFINDTIRSEFHKRFMDKYVK